MIDSFDYKEPECIISSGKDFYYPDSDAPEGHIPVDRIIEKLDMLFSENDLDSAGKLLEYWRGEAVALKDKRGELSILSELVGYYRKTMNREPAEEAVNRALDLVSELEEIDSIPGATVLLNCATTLKAFGTAEEALPLYETAELVYDRLLQPDDIQFAGLYNNYALTLTDIGRYEDAEKKYFLAIDINARKQHGECDSAVSYVNMAYLYKSWEKNDMIDACLDAAYSLLMTENLPRDGYYAFVCEKCAPAFAYFGCCEISEELTKIAGEIYAGN